MISSVCLQFNVGILPTGKGVYPSGVTVKKVTILSIFTNGARCGIDLTEEAALVRCDDTAPPPGDNRPEASSVYPPL